MTSVPSRAPDAEILDNEDGYHSSSDEDFNPDEAPADDDDVSSSEDEAHHTADAPSQRRRKRGSPGADADGWDSGDEATIRERKLAKRRKVKGKGKGKGGGKDSDKKGDEEDEGVVVFSDEETGEGGLIKTRAQRMKEEKERRPLATAKGATIDVDSIWARLASTPVSRNLEEDARMQQQKGDLDINGVVASAGGEVIPKPPQEEYITIKRTYRFAGQVQTEERRVPKTSEEARLYLAEQEKAAKSKKDDAGEPEPSPEEAPESPQQEQHKPLRRPLKRPSRFEPNPLGEVKGLPPEHQLRWPRTTIDPTRPGDAGKLAAAAASAAARLGPGNKPQKLNTVEKSRHDWVKFVDKEGISEELDEYGRAKESYLGRMEFLGRTENKKEEERRRVRLGTAATVGSGVGGGGGGGGGGL